MELSLERGGPSLEGKKALAARPGEGPFADGGPAGRRLAGDPGPAAGFTRSDLTDPAGDAGRAIEPNREATTGEEGRGIPFVSLETCGTVGESSLCGEGGFDGPLVLLSLSSSWVLSFGGKGPTSCHTFSPART